MKESAYCLFETPLGRCGIAWSERENQTVITFLQFPEATLERTESRIAHCSGARPSSPPLGIAEVIRRVCTHLQGEVQDFRNVRVDLGEAPPFARRVYGATREIPPGETRTCGELARALGLPGASRAVGQALGKNPIPLIIPCHRVVAAGGRAGGFSAPGGRDTKARLLAIEGATFRGQGQLPLISERLSRRLP